MAMVTGGENEGRGWSPKARPFGFESATASRPAVSKLSHLAMGKPLNSPREKGNLAVLVSIPFAIGFLALAIFIVSQSGSDASGSSGRSSVLLVPVLAILAGFYFLPPIVASNRRHPQAGAIMVLTIFLGWTLVGWVAALVWACTTFQRVGVARTAVPVAPAAPAAPLSTADEIEQFARLKETGVITADEFEAKKRQLLGFG